MLATEHTHRVSEGTLAAEIALQLDKIEESLCDMPRVAAAGKLDELIVERPFDFVFLRHGLPGQQALINED